MEHLRTEDGQPLRVSGDAVYDAANRRVGRVYGSRVFTPGGRYIGSIVGNRVLFQSTGSAASRSLYAPAASSPAVETQTS